MKSLRLVSTVAFLTISMKLLAISPGVVCQPNDFPFVGKFESRTDSNSPWNFVGSGSVIGHKWMLTARHVAGSNATGNVRFKLDSGNYVYPVAVWRMSQYFPMIGYGHEPYASWEDLDIAWDTTIVQFPAASFSGPFVDLYSGTNELGMAITAVGYGHTASQPNPATPQWSLQTGSAGVRRLGTNVISVVSTRTVIQNPETLSWDWDGYGNWPPPSNGDPTPELFDWFAEGGPTANECAVLYGDSGGPSLAQFTGSWRIIGLHASVYWPSPWGYGYNTVSFDRRVCERLYDYAQQLMLFY